MAIDNDGKAGRVFYQRVGRTLMFIDYLEENNRTLYSRELFTVGQLSDDKHTVHNGRLKQALVELRGSRRTPSECVFVTRVRPEANCKEGYDYVRLVGFAAICFSCLVRVLLFLFYSACVSELVFQFGKLISVTCLGPPFVLIFFTVLVLIIICSLLYLGQRT